MVAGHAVVSLSMLLQKRPDKAMAEMAAAYEEASLIDADSEVLSQTALINLTFIGLIHLNFRLVTSLVNRRNPAVAM